MEVVYIVVARNMMRLILINMQLLMMDLVTLMFQDVWTLQPLTIMIMIMMVNLMH